MRRPIAAPQAPPETIDDLCTRLRVPRYVLAFLEQADREEWLTPRALAWMSLGSVALAERQLGELVSLGLAEYATHPRVRVLYRLTERGRLVASLAGAISRA